MAHTDLLYVTMYVRAYATFTSLFYYYFSIFSHSLVQSLKRVHEYQKERQKTKNIPVSDTKLTPIALV